ncbi:MAG: FmdB family transcriptional regulator [Pleurocapsa sp. SU_196_0]|nr:FmdB family transcriptional regulator [Pleurocapsa sp. SU_196_0]
MPIYVYQGLTSGDTFEIEQRISEAALTTHPSTGEPVKRLIGRPAISFKGSGFTPTIPKAAPRAASTNPRARPLRAARVTPRRARRRWGKR